MDVSSAYQSLADHLEVDGGRFYSPGSGLHLGVGQIYDDIRFPAYNLETKRFSTLEGLVYVLTHECDVDRRNDRPFSDLVLICPIIKFEEWAPRFSSQFTDSVFSSFLGRVGMRQISRVFYLPIVSSSILPYGGLLYLNQIAHTHRDFFDIDKRKTSLTSYGLQKVDQILTNHLLREKNERLAFDS